MEDNTPDFQKTAMREFREECSARLGVLNFDSDMVFIGAECNSFRDVRWAKANNYVPTVAAIFASALKDPGLPQVRGRDDACGNAYWVPLKVIERVYRQHKGVFGLFNEPFTPEAFSGFIQDTSMFHLDQEDHPRNILKIENSILANVKSNEFVIHYNERTHYRASDFAFDHVKNIVRARDMMRYKESCNCRPDWRSDPTLPQTPAQTRLKKFVVFHTLWDAVEPPVDVKFPQKHLPNNSTDVTYKHEGSQLADQIFILAASCANDRVFVALLRAKFVPPTQAKEANPDFIATYGGILF
ncbi:hypothetical protein BC830DRAFT_569860 [Chytriomyces sp. MP71]|nr:hypothetical protein BC830DRAFT_569860 [Chytriomyces sp. MP71]